MFEYSCTMCKTLFSVSRKRPENASGNYFCSQSCSASYNNKVPLKEQREHIAVLFAVLKRLRGHIIVKPVKKRNTDLILP